MRPRLHKGALDARADAHAVSPILVPCPRRAYQASTDTCITHERGSGRVPSAGNGDDNFASICTRGVRGNRRSHDLKMCRRTEVDNCTTLALYPFLGVIPEMLKKVDYHVDRLLPDRKARQPRVGTGRPISDRVRGEEELEPFASRLHKSAGDGGAKEAAA
jgi:hypothetical protein